MKNLLNELFKNFVEIEKIINFLSQNEQKRLKIEGIVGSANSFLLTKIFLNINKDQCIILEDKETASFFYDDLLNILGEDENIMFLPSVYKHSLDYFRTDSTNIILKTEILSKLKNHTKPLLIVTFPGAIIEKVVSLKELEKNTLEISTGADLPMDFVIDVLNDYGFHGDHFVYEPGTFSVRGSIIDVFSYSAEKPYRIDFFGDTIDSIRSFDIETQLSLNKLDKITIIPNVHENIEIQQKQSFFELLDENWTFWLNKSEQIFNKIEKAYNTAVAKYEESINELITNPKQDLVIINPQENLISKDIFLTEIQKFKIIESTTYSYFQTNNIVKFNTNLQPIFNKNFNIITEDFHKNIELGYKIYILSNNEKQIQRIKDIFEDKGDKLDFIPIYKTVNEGFISKEDKICVYTDHQIFERYHRYNVQNFSRKDSLSLKDISGLHPGDYVVHIDNGIGKFAGLQTIDIQGKKQEVVTLIYGNNDILYVSVHSLHKISKYRDADGEVPKIYPLGSGTWKRLKEKTKKNIKDIAKDLILLYAKRVEMKGFSFNPDNYMQYELESSFIYEDTPDQIKTNDHIKRDMESEIPMDRLVCGDVGFGKTELAVRAAFKAACDSKQTAVLVPTTILALQHYQTFSERLKEFPVKVAYINRFKSTTEIKKILAEIKDGKIDILIGTHRIVNKDVVFKDLGLLIIDEEQKFGVSVKERIRQMKTNIDTLTLTATPIPRTLQFSLMGARDMSILSMPPPNRQAINTEVHIFNNEIIKEAINYEIARNGQVFFVNNRIQNIYEIELLINKLCPKVKTIVAHGQMEGDKLEKIILEFIRGDYDVLISTAIIENGVDIPNVNTIIINNANNFGLSDLHQLRGRVGRSNKKAFCYLLSPPEELLTPEARRRLRAIEEYSELGSGFNIAMQDLDIRGAGNILGSEQSGFIADIGYETYTQILNEAVAELKEGDFKDLFKDKQSETIKINKNIDCIVETDFNVLIPDYYISNTTERIKIYKDLDSMSNIADLEIFKTNLEDRFGKIPEETLNLFKVVELRQITKKYCFHKILLKNSLFIGYFPKDQKSNFYFSSDFTTIINYIQKNQKQCELKMKNDELTLRIKNINSINLIIKIFKEINDLNL